MLDRPDVWGISKSAFSVFTDVAFFWQKKAWSWWTQPTPREALVETLAEARIFEEWEAAAYQLDELLGNDLWRQNSTSKHYDYRLIYERLQAILEAEEDEDILALVNLLRSGLVRNLGNITAPRLFNRAYAGTKLLIEDYVTQVALAIKAVASYPTSPGDQTGWTSQAKLDLLHDTRQAFGKSVLVLQGGSIFGLCHLGVVKALHLRGLLPRIIAGTATGALIAALVGVHTEDELLEFLTGDGIDLSAFSSRSGGGMPNGTDIRQSGWLATLNRRVRRFIREGYFLDIGVLEQCVRANVGDLTFEEAYARTKRVLNITIAGTEGSGVPSLLNYLTAPNVLIWSAALASNASSSPLYSPVSLYCKNENGVIVPWVSAHDSTFKQWTHHSTLPSSSSTNTLTDAPLPRIAELFNVNHFIVSQARPYVVPFLHSDLHTANPRHDTSRGLSLTRPVVRLMLMELQHRLHQLDALGYLPYTVRRFLLDENIPTGASLTLVPELTAGDFLRLLENPTKQSVEYWISRGERSVWPAVTALKVRCAVEVELDRGYQFVRRKKPMEVIRAASEVANGKRESEMVDGERESEEAKVKRRKRSRASSVNAG